MISALLHMSLSSYEGNCTESWHSTRPMDSFLARPHPSFCWERFNQRPVLFLRRVAEMSFVSAVIGPRQGDYSLRTDDFLPSDRWL